MDQQTFELLRVLQSGERSANGFTEIQQLLEPQRRALHAADDRASLADISELLEVWAEGAPPPQAAAALAHAATIAEHDLEQSERAVGLYARSLELDPTQSALFDRVEHTFKQLAQHERFEAVLVKAADALRASGETGAAAAAGALRRLGKLRLQLKSGLDGAIAAYEQALELSADVELIRELADLYAQRRADGDDRQAADLYATLAEVHGAEGGVPLLERALDLVPGHVEALTLLESFVPEAARAERLRDRWVAFVKDTEDDAAASERMIALAHLSAERGEHHAVLEWVAPAAERGDAVALELQAQALAAIQQQEAASASADGTPQVRPPTLVGFRVPAGKAPASGADQASAPGARKPKKPRSGDTIVGFRVSEEWAAMDKEREAAEAAKRSGSLDAAFASASAPAGKGAFASKGAPNTKSSAPAKDAATKPATNAAKPAAARAAAQTTSAPARRPVAATAPSSAPAPRKPPAGAAPPARRSASLSPAQRSAALRNSSPPPQPAATSAAPASMSPAAAHAAALRATTPGPVSSPAAGAQAPAAAARGAAPARASSAPAFQPPAATSTAGGVQRTSIGAPPALPRSSQAPQPNAVTALPQGGQAQAIGAAAVQARIPSTPPVTAGSAPAPRSASSDLDRDELSGVRTRPTLLDKRVLAIAAAVVVALLGLGLLLRGKPGPSTPPAASAGSARADEPPPATAPASAIGSASAATTASAPASAAPANAAMPSGLAAAVTPPPAAAPPARVAPEPTQGRVEVQVAEIRIKGGKLRTKDLLGAMNENLRALQHCYEEVLEDRPKTIGSLSFGFTIDKKGDATKVKKAGGTIKDSRLLKCTARAIEKTQFPKPAKQKPAQVVFPLEFKKS